MTHGITSLVIRCPIQIHYITKGFQGQKPIWRKNQNDFKSEKDVQNYENYSRFKGT